MQNARARRGNEENGLLTFDAIAHSLGITRQMAQLHYTTGMAKLRLRRLTPRFQVLKRLLESREALAAERSASVLSSRAFE